jgi:hypothetical protein
MYPYAPIWRDLRIGGKILKIIAVSGIITNTKILENSNETFLPALAS